MNPILKLLGHGATGPIGAGGLILALALSGLPGWIIGVGIAGITLVTFANSPIAAKLAEKKPKIKTEIKGGKVTATMVPKGKQ